MHNGLGPRPKTSWYSDTRTNILLYARFKNFEAKLPGPLNQQVGNSNFQIEIMGSFVPRPRLHCGKTWDYKPNINKKIFSQKPLEGEKLNKIVFKVFHNNYYHSL